MHLFDQGMTKMLAALTFNVQVNKDLAKSRQRIAKPFVRLNLESLRETFERIKVPSEESLLLVLTSAY